MSLSASDFAVFEGIFPNFLRLRNESIALAEISTDYSSVEKQHLTPQALVFDL